MHDDREIHPNRFWRWLGRQKWRKMLPEPFTCLRCLLLVYLHMPYITACVACARIDHFQKYFIYTIIDLRTDVVLVNPAAKNQYLIGSWDVLLPSDVLLGL